MFCECRDLKDMLSQHGKVLFVDEPRTVRLAVVHFASLQDRDQVFAAHHNGAFASPHLEMVPVRSASAKSSRCGVDCFAPFDSTQSLQRCASHPDVIMQVTLAQLHRDGCHLQIDRSSALLHMGAPPMPMAGMMPMQQHMPTHDLMHPVPPYGASYLDPYSRYALAPEYSHPGLQQPGPSAHAGMYAGAAQLPLLSQPAPGAQPAHYAAQAQPQPAPHLQAGFAQPAGLHGGAPQPERVSDAHRHMPAGSVPLGSSNVRSPAAGGSSHAPSGSGDGRGDAAAPGTELQQMMQQLALHGVRGEAPSGDWS